MSQSNQSRTVRWLRHGLAGAVVATALGGSGAGCLARPVAKQEPNTTNVFVDTLQQTAVDKIDLLFLIDNSISMADKQALLEKAVPVLVRRLVTPFCVDPNNTDSTPTPPPCGAGQQEEFAPIRDIHIGVISSSLGTPGTPTVCPFPSTTNTNNDKSHLMGTERNLPNFNGTGFLFWGPDKGGETDSGKLEREFQQHVRGAGEFGCGFEAQLEAVHRFLSDPSPPAGVTTANFATQPERNPDGTIIKDTVVEAQRRAFLRPDSLLAIVSLSDENDCSLNINGIAPVLSDSDPGRIPRGRAACDANPNDPCCVSCGQTPPAGCPANDPCTPFSEAAKDNATNSRCFDHKRRYGIDLLYPLKRYVNALKLPRICPEADDLDPSRCADPVQNPIYSDLEGQGRTPRTSDLVFYAQIVGVPWQDIATDDTRTDATKPLRYLKASEITDERWGIIVGDSAASPPVPPGDPFMIESQLERSGVNPITNTAITPYGTTNDINGSEYPIPDRGDLQYACIYQLETPRDCPATAGGPGCDCKGSATQKPLCEGNRQVKAKAYPGLRQLRVAREFGDNAIVGSICPKQPTGNADDPGFGYTPAVSAIIDRLKDALQGKCLPRALATDPTTGEVLCKLVEAVPPANGACGGCDPNLLRKDATPEVAEAVRAQLLEKGICSNDGVGATKCSDLCLCEYERPSQAATDACISDANSTQPAWCYINDAANPLVAKCPATQKRLLRLVNTPSNPLPTPGGTVVIACLGDAISAQQNANP
jgi:hypothetical protein